MQSYQNSCFTGYFFFFSLSVSRNLHNYFNKAKKNATELENVTSDANNEEKK